MRPTAEEFGDGLFAGLGGRDAIPVCRGHVLITPAMCCLAAWLVATAMVKWERLPRGPPARCR
jgi:hypothetical protein